MAIRLYPIIAGVLPLRNRLMLIQFADGATYTVSCLRLNRIEAEDNHRNAAEVADHEQDPEEADELRRRSRKGWLEWCALNSDFVQVALESRWDAVSPRHVSGPRTTVPNNDRLWWVDENGGSLRELADLPPWRQRRMACHWVDRRPGFAEDGAGRCEASAAMCYGRLTASP